MLWLKLAHVIVKGASGGHQSDYHDFELNAWFWNIRFMRLFQKVLFRGPRQISKPSDGMLFHLYGFGIMLRAEENIIDKKHGCLF